MIVVLDMRDDDPCGPFVAFVKAGEWALEVRGRTPAEARSRARRLRRELGGPRLLFGLV